MIIELFGDAQKVNNKYNAAICIPTYNAGDNWDKVIKALLMQKIQLPVLVIDSNSKDQTVYLAQNAGFNTKIIDQKDFDHGGTRNLGFKTLQNYEIIIFLTQDAILADEYSILNILKSFDINPSIAMAYGRQLPHINASLMAQHARLYNYPDKSILKGKASYRELGIKTIFCSNSFSAYRRKIIQSYGYFPNKIIFGEDTTLAKKLISDDHLIYYNADALIYHSHDYNSKDTLILAYFIALKICLSTKNIKLAIPDFLLLNQNFYLY